MRPMGLAGRTRGCVPVLLPALVREDDDTPLNIAPPDMDAPTLPPLDDRDRPEP